MACFYYLYIFLKVFRKWEEWFCQYGYEYSMIVANELLDFDDFLLTDSQFPGHSDRCRNPGSYGWVSVSWSGPSRHKQRISSQVNFSWAWSTINTMLKRSMTALCFCVQDWLCPGSSVWDICHTGASPLQPCCHDPTKWGVSSMLRAIRRRSYSLKILIYTSLALLGLMVLSLRLSGQCCCHCSVGPMTTGDNMRLPCLRWN